jgi:hypothetical protein
VEGLFLSSRRHHLPSFYQKPRSDLDNIWGREVQNAKNIGNFTTPLKPHNIGTHLKGIESSFEVIPLFLEYFNFWVFYHVLKLSQNTFGLII